MHKITSITLFRAEGSIDETRATKQAMRLSFNARQLEFVLCFEYGWWRNWKVLRDLGGWWCNWGFLRYPPEHEYYIWAFCLGPFRLYKQTIYWMKRKQEWRSRKPNFFSEI